MILLDFLQPRQTINSDCYFMVMTKLKASTSSQADKTTLLLQNNNARPSTSLKTMDHTALPILAGLPHHIYSIAWIWCFLTSICLGPWNMIWSMQATFSWQQRCHRSWEAVGNLHWCRFLWAQHGCSCSLLVKCIANGSDYAEKQYFVAENFLYQIKLLCSLL